MEWAPPVYVHLARSMNRPLTNQQRAVYEFIRDKIVDRGYGPTVREIGEHMQIKSPNGVVCHLRALERKGMINRAANKSRAIELTDPVNRRPLGELPIHGEVVRGTYTACSDRENAIDLGLLAAVGRYAVQVRDNSLIGMHIALGDFLIIQSQSVCEVGQLVLVESASNSTILCLCCRENDRKRLNPLSPSMLRSHYYIEDVTISGIVVGSVRAMG